MQEEELKGKITIEQAKKLEKPTEGFLCQRQDNKYDLEFVYFKVRCYDTNTTFFEIAKPPELYGKKLNEGMRTIRYNFGPKFLDLKRIGATIKFRIGKQPLKKLTMVENHYFKDKLIKEYSFDFPFCIPGTTNEIETIYEMQEEMINCPFQTKADTFYFEEGKLIMHNKSEFAYGQTEAV